MIKKLKVAALVLLAFGFQSMAQQETQGGSLNYVGEAASMRVVPSLSSRTSSLTLAPDWNGQEPQDGRYVRGVKSNVVPGKDPQTENDYFSSNPGKLDKKINLTRSLENDFVVNNNVGSPSDPALAVGPNHVVIVFNTGFIIYDKDGNALTGPLNVNNIFSNGGCCDLTASYDNAADRWVLTYLFVGAGMELAVSDGPDPTTANWTLYSFPQVSDYNKLSVWRDGYYITDNGPNDVWAIDRDAALAGDPAASIQGFVVNGISSPNGGFTSAQVANVTDDNLPTTGGAPLVYMRDDGFQGVTEDEYWLWTIDVDFDNPANSGVSVPQEFPAIPFINVFDGGGFSNLTQPGGGIAIDALQSTIMNQMQFRKFATHNSIIFNFVVDTDATAGELAGIRWVELRQSADGMPWSLFQEGTYNAPDGKHAWMGSMAMDNQGNIGMGYSSMAGPTTPNPLDNRVGAFYTGRFASDDPGVMSIDEVEIAIGTQNIAGLRFGDYAKLDVDPNNDKEFWFITEYANTNHVAKFQIQSDFDNDLGVVSIDAPVNGDLAAPQDVTVTIFNFGLNDVTGFDVTYAIDGGALVTESFAGTIASATSAEFTFTTQGDFSTVGQTYSITASTVFAADEFADNDATTREVTHLNPDDVGATNVTAPISDASQVTIEIENFGTATQTSIPVFYTLNGGAPVQETYTGSIAFGATDTYTFTATEDLSALGDYVFVAGTELAGDSDETNDDTTATVTNAICEPESNCAGFDDGVTQIALADQDISVNCSASGYTDDTDTVFNFVLDENPFEGVLQMGFADSVFALWIDFNDNNTFEADELIANEFVAQANADFAFTVDFSTVVADVTPGMHRMRLRGEDESTGGDVLDPCDDLQFGRTNDYTANISGTLGTADELFAATDLQVHSLGNDQFEVIFNDTSSFSQKLPITVYNTLGQTLAYYTVDNNGAGYTKIIDMSYVSSGVYFVKVGTADLNKVRRIIVE
ncbi:GEVED domain-containing protein [Dokdonia ponticola]|uniref:GEVED domain-containing protein n=1 Tax=Dokdonia ponticola TaxID=2041041 RepID=A0ABV9HYE9_9FLAO